MSLVGIAVPFVHPALAGAAVAAGMIPILVHLINRRRYRRVPWAAMVFLLAANRRTAKRVWFEQVLLMAVRIALVVLLGWALARPYLPANALVPIRSSRVHRILVLDDSLSMNAAVSEGPTRFDITKAYADQLLSSFPQGDPISLVTMAAPAEAPVGHAAYDRRFVRERLAGLGPTQRAGDPVGALEKCRGVVQDSETPEGNRAVYLLSDFAAVDWNEGEDGADAPALAALRRLAEELGRSTNGLNLIRVTTCTSDAGADGPGGGSGPGAVASCPIGNVALTRLVVETPLTAAHLPVRVSLDVANTGSVVARNVAVQVRRDGQIVREEPLPRLSPGQSRTITLSTRFSQPGTHVLEARLVGRPRDALLADDARYLSVDVRGSVPVLLVDGQPGTTLLTGQAGFLATALAPSGVAPGHRPASSAAATPVVPTTVTSSELSSQPLSQYDVIALCNVGRLTEADWRRLADFVRDGGGLMIFAGDLVDPASYNREVDADGAGLLAGTIERSVAAVGPGSSPESPGVGLDPESMFHPIVGEFADYPTSSLFLARVLRYVPIRVNASRAEVVARFTNGDPALVVSSFGRGRVLLCATTANMDWNNLPAKGDYVSLMFNAVAFLAKQHGGHRNVVVGQTIREPLSAVESSMELSVVGPSGRVAEPTLEPEGGGLSMRFGPVADPGVVTFTVGLDRRLYAANVDPGESAILPTAEDELCQRLSAPCTEVTASGWDAAATEAGGLARRSARYNELASLLTYAVLVLLLAEAWLAMRVGAPARRARRSRGTATGRIHALSFRRAERNERDRMAV
jgi:uncharacterized membrane protein